MKYNTQREKLILPEYGREIQQMVDTCMAIPEREQRQMCAETIIEIMAIMNPTVRQQPDYKHKLWDQLDILSDYNLDIDWPFERVERSAANARPRPLKYPMQRIRYRHYGHLTEAFIRKLKDMPEGEERDALTQMMANYMKRSLCNWNPDAMDEQKIAEDIFQYTDGQVTLPEDFKFAQVSADRSLQESGRKKRKKS
ncbi:MAG: DUF4290 domain-containing protein [Bacteroidaceae bacterium]|nr:DUF4290 domain-containing protein [Bacteroidaceae bacterium]